LFVVATASAKVEALAQVKRRELCQKEDTAKVREIDTS